MSRAAAKEQQSSEVQLVCFVLAGDLYAVDIMRIKEIVSYQKIRPVPRSPKYVQGVINLRGAVLPVVDLRHRFSLPDTEDPDTGRRILITSLSGRIVGLVVDAVTEILKLDVDAIARVPSLINRRETAYVHGVAVTEDEMVLVLNLDRILSSDEQIDMDKVRRAALEETGLGGEAQKGSPEEDAQSLAEALLGGFAREEAVPPEIVAAAEPSQANASSESASVKDETPAPAESKKADEGVSTARALSKRKKKKKPKKERNR